MREIKFRAWIRVEKRFDYSGDLRDYDYARRYFNSLEDNDIDDGDVILMQYTGLKDKNGKEIYEGDLFKMEEVRGEENGFCLVVWIDDISAFGFEPVGSPGMTTLLPESKDMEVIGNIHDDLDLLNTG